MARRTGGSNQHGVLSEPEMCEVRGLGKNVEVCRGWGLNLSKHSLEVFNEQPEFNLKQASARQLLSLVAQVQDKLRERRCGT
jgi:hypothetical protein